VPSATVEADAKPDSERNNFLGLGFGDVPDLVALSSDAVGDTAVHGATPQS
jgi:hypothetical protein